jgi:heme A synthase
MKTAARVSLLTLVLTVILIGIGALVRATGSGLGCPDWPLCHGGAVPPTDLGHEPVIEFLHRAVAAVVGLLIIATAWLAWRHFRASPVVAWGAVLAVPLVGLQGLLGAIVVWHELPPELVATHLLLAMLIVSVEAMVTVGMFRELGKGQDPEPERIGPLGSLSVLALAWLALTFWIGAYMAESGASTACSGWPLCNGAPFPGADDQEVTHMVHRYLAGGFVFVLLPLLVSAWRRRHLVPWALPVALAAAAVFVAQVIVGAFNVWYTFPDPLTVSHTFIAATIWATLSVGASLATYRRVGVAATVLEPAEAAR